MSIYIYIIESRLRQAQHLVGPQVVPTRELAAQIHREAERFAPSSQRAAWFSVSLGGPGAQPGGF